MAETRSQLIARKEDLLAALRSLERDRADGAIDPDAYRRARERYEWEAAEVLESLEALPVGDAIPVRRSVTPARVVAVGATLIAIVALGLVLSGMIHPRAAGGAVTGSVPTPVSGPVMPPSPHLLAAERAASRYPRSVAAALQLGNAFLSGNQVSAADAQFRRAMRLDPGGPEPATMHALVLGSMYGHLPPALRLLSHVERFHPEYARAWLIDGLLASRSTNGRARSIAAFHRFLAIEPRSSVATEVRSLLAALNRRGHA